MNTFFIPFKCRFHLEYFMLSANSQFSHSNNFEYSTWSTLVTANLWKMRSYSKETIFPSKQVSSSVNQNIRWIVSFHAKDTYPMHFIAPHDIHYHDIKLLNNWWQLTTSIFNDKTHAVSIGYQKYAISSGGFKQLHRLNKTQTH